MRKHIDKKTNNFLFASIIIKQALQVYKTLSRPERIDEELEEDPEEYFSNQEENEKK